MAEPVLLTGATGFVGRAVLTELVAQGIPVHAVARRNAGPDLPGVTWHLTDLLDPQACATLIRHAPASRLIHCAWYVEHGAFWASPLNAVWARASEDLARRFLDKGGQRIIALGTCAEYAWLGKGDAEPWPETREIAAATPYGQSKADLHQRLASLCEMTPGASLVWARLFHLYGPGEPQARLVPSLIRSLAAGQLAEVRAANLVRDFASTAHIARSLVALLNSQASGPFNLGSGTSLTLAQVAQIIADHFGRPHLLRLSHNPPPHEPVAMVPDLSRLAAATGIRNEDPRKVLSHLIASLLDEGAGRS